MFRPNFLTFSNNIFYATIVLLKLFKYLSFLQSYINLLKVTRMESNLLSILNIINDNIKFGSDLHVEYVFNLFKKFPIKNAEKQKVWKELDSLDIKLLYPDRFSKDEVLELITYISSNKNVYKTDLIDWFYKESISKEKQEQIIEILNTSNYLIIDNKVEKSNNLSLLIFYIENNIRYGSNIEINTIFKWLQKYSVTNSKKKFVWKELESLNVEITDNGKPLEKDVLRFLKSADLESKIYTSKINECLNNKKIELPTQKRIKQLLISLGYQIIDDVTLKKPENEDKNLIEDQDNYILDDLLDNSDFEKEVVDLKDTINKNNNSEYLNDYLNGSSEAKRDNALDSLVKANKNLVISIVKKYSIFSSVAFDQEDMFQAGMIGLMKAAEKFNLKLGTQFSTYATFWIRQSININIDNFSNTIRLPVYIQEKIKKYIKLENEYWYENGKLPTSEELSKIFKTSNDEIDQLKAYKNLSKLNRLEDPITFDNDTTLGEFIVDDNSPSPEYILEQKDLKKQVDLALHAVLNDKEVFVVKLRYGIFDGKEYTLEEIGEKLNVTRERIRQIQAKAIQKLKSGSRTKILKELYYD